jgi:hypothetical protein
MNNYIDPSVEPDFRDFRPEECIPLEQICTDVSRCICVRPGSVSREILDALDRHDYDQAPVYDPQSKICYGIVDKSYLRQLLEENRELKPNDSHVSNENAWLRIGSHTFIYQLIYKLKSEHAILVIRESDNTEHGFHASLYGLFTISDLNRHEIRSVLYRLFSDVETDIANLVESYISEPWEWISLLGEDHQVRILGYWELAKRRNVDIGPVAATTLTNLLTIVGKTSDLLAVFGYQSRSKFDEYAGKLPDFRNRIMHPVRPLILEPKDVEQLYLVVRFLEELKNRLREKFKQKQ